MKKLNCVSRISALLLVFVLVWFAGCGTTPQAGDGQSGGGSGTEDGGAAQLAADLGKAVSGDTVTLTGWAGLKTALTVPAGVTLDVTADGAALELRDGAVLTVDGTVNALGHGDHGNGWVEGSLRIGDGAAVIDGNGTIRLASKGHLLEVGGKRHLTLDGVTLVGLADNDSSLVEVNGGGELVLKSGTITGNTHTSEESANGGGVTVYSAIFIMAGGAITGNTVIAGENKTGNGGGVRTGSGATFRMTGGTISSNTATSISKRGEGGGVAVNDSSFIMEGGTIYGKADSLPAGTDASLANNANASNGAVSLRLYRSTAKWGIGGIYQGGDSQTGGADILKPNELVRTDDTLIAIPAK
jgi:hypothetical protein